MLFLTIKLHMTAASVCFNAPNFEKVEGAYWFDPVRQSVMLSCGHDILRTVLRYGVDIWFTISLPYEDVLISF